MKQAFLLYADIALPTTEVVMAEDHYMKRLGILPQVKVEVHLLIFNLRFIVLGTWRVRHKRTAAIGDVVL